MKTEDLVAKIKDVAPRVELSCEALGITDTRYLVEGDIGLPEDKILTYAAERVDLAERMAKDPAVVKRGLVAVTKDGNVVRWQRGKELDYCVYRPTFNSDEEYQTVVANMRIATAEWSAMCGVRFRYRDDKDRDANLQLGDVLFPVVRQDGGENTLAMAFFPNETDVQRRIVWIFDGYYGDSFNKVGILRHELGHVLGFRHEHIRPEAPDYFGQESTDDTLNLTDYDPKSVMHYVAREVGDPQLLFTEADKEGSLKVYGPPDKGFEFID